MLTIQSQETDHDKYLAQWRQKFNDAFNRNGALMGLDRTYKRSASGLPFRSVLMQPKHKRALYEEFKGSQPVRCLEFYLKKHGFTKREIDSFPAAISGRSSVQVGRAQEMQNCNDKFLREMSFPEDCLCPDIYETKTVRTLGRISESLDLLTRIFKREDAKPFLDASMTAKSIRHRLNELTINLRADVLKAILTPNEEVKLKDRMFSLRLSPADRKKWSSVKSYFRKTLKAIMRRR